MQKKYDLFLNILRQFGKAGILDEVILIGSWCMYFYKDYISGGNYHPSIRTRDIDIFVPLPIKSKKKINIAELLIYNFI